MSWDGISRPGWSNSGEVVGATSRVISLLGTGVVFDLKEVSEGTTSG